MSPGLRELEAHLTKSFAGHPDPQIIPRWGIPQWMGGNEAIDFIYVYSINHPELGEYWHFITAGLSDLFGDGRVNFPIYEDHDLSGFGIELSVMVRKQSQHIPVWPPTILHKLARYIFESGNRILPGDNIPNNTPIENNSSLRHFLAVKDLFVKKMSSTIGEVSFVQLVGVADNEWNAANNWSGSQFTDLLIETDKNLLIIDPRRGETIFDLHPELISEIQRRQVEFGSDSACVSSKCSWEFDDFRDQEGIRRRVALLRFTHRTFELFKQAIHGRLMYRRHFTIKMNEDFAISFVPEGSKIETVTKKRKIAVTGQLLQLFITQELLQDLIKYLPTTLSSSDQLDFSSDGLVIEVVEDL